MKNLNFVDPEVEVVSKQEIFNDLLVNDLGRFSPEDIEWLDSITNEITLTLDEADVFCKFLKDILFQSSLIKFIEGCASTPKESNEPMKPIEITYENLDENRHEPKPTNIDKPSFLFNNSFFPDVQDDTNILNRFFRTDLLDNERIKSISFLFMKIGDKETFHPHSVDMIKKIRALCARSEAFAEAYQAKLAEFRNNNGPLQERLALYFDAYSEEILSEGNYTNLIRELEQPILKIISDNDFTLRRHSRPLLDLLLFSLLQTPDGMQVPRWDEKNYLCKLLLDYEDIYHFGILDKLFRNYTITEVFLIIRNYTKWCNDNKPQYPASKSEEDLKNHRKEYTKFLEAQLAELFSGAIPHKYLDLLYNFLFPRFSGNMILREKGFLRQVIETKVSPSGNYLIDYLADKIVSMISENNHEHIQEISHLLDNENEDWIGKKYLQSRISSVMKFFEIGDHAEKWRHVLRDSKHYYKQLESLLVSLVKSQKDKNTTPLSLEDFVLKYIPLEIFPEIIRSSFFRKQNEDVYQSMIQQYPSLSREDALINRLLPCFTAIAFRNTDEILTMLDWTDDTEYNPVVKLFLCVLDQLCKRHEKEHESIALIFEIIFRKRYCIPVIVDIIKKYPQTQQLIFEHCYKVLKETLNTTICTPITSHQIQASVPACIVGMHKGLWHGLKHLFIALRKTRMELVDESLSVNEDCHPNGNNNLVKEIMLYFDFFRESLKSLRQDMANGFSDWLKPLPESKGSNLEKRLVEFLEIEQSREGFNITYTEPDPVWRYAYVRAIADLGVDVDGKGHYIHSVMDMVAQKDPSEMVRTAAEKTSAKLKKLRNGWDGNNHYQKITYAFWWIKQASRLALNLPINRKGSLKTRDHDGQENDFNEERLIEIKEILMKKEKEKQEIERIIKLTEEETEKAKEEREVKKTKQIENEMLMRARLKI